MGLFFWIIIIIIIVATVKNEKAKQEKVNQEYAKRVHSSGQTKSSLNSYYSKQKVEQYRKMEQDHADHNDDENDDVCSEIGYKRCPKCDTLVSKKADACFMCDYSFLKNTAESKK